MAAKIVRGQLPGLPNTDPIPAGNYQLSNGEHLVLGSAKSRAELAHALAPRGIALGAAPGDRLLAERVGGRLVPAQGHRGTDTVLVKMRKSPAAPCHIVHSHQEAAALQRDLMRQGKTGTIVVIESEQEQAAAEYVRRRMGTGRGRFD